MIVFNGELSIVRDDARGEQSFLLQLRPCREQRCSSYAYGGSVYFVFLPNLK